MSFVHCTSTCYKCLLLDKQVLCMYSTLPIKTRSYGRVVQCILYRMFRMIDTDTLCFDTTVQLYMNDIYSTGTSVSVLVLVVGLRSYLSFVESQSKVRSFFPSFASTGTVHTSILHFFLSESHCSN
jgi:hypothetical protein